MLTVVQWRKLHSEELHDLFPLPGPFRIIETRTASMKQNTAI